MSTMLKLSEGACIGLHAMVLLSISKERLLTTSQIADTLNISKAHLSKILQRLVKVGYVDSTRGPGGGFKLKNLEEDISLLDVYEAIEGPLHLSNCLFTDAVCKGSGCIFSGLVKEINRSVYDYLKNTTLPDLGKVYE